MCICSESQTAKDSQTAKHSECVVGGLSPKALEGLIRPSRALKALEGPRALKGPGGPYKALKAC